MVHNANQGILKQGDRGGYGTEVVLHLVAVYSLEDAYYALCSIGSANGLKISQTRQS